MTCLLSQDTPVRQPDRRDQPTVRIPITVIDPLPLLTDAERAAEVLSAYIQSQVAVWLIRATLKAFTVRALDAGLRLLLQRGQLRLYKPGPKSGEGLLYEGECWAEVGP